MWNKSLTDLQFHLAELFPLKEDIIRLAGTAGLSIASLSVSDKGIVFWYNVLMEARQHGKLGDIITEARRIFPNDSKLISFNASMIYSDQEFSLPILKDLCADLIRENQFREAIPLLEDIMSRSPAGSELEENIVVRSADVHRHQQDAEQFEGKKRTRSLRFLENSKSDMISLVCSL